MIGLRYACDWRVLLWEVIYFTSSIYLHVNFEDLSWMAFLALWVTSVSFSFFGATITHNAIHVPLFRNAKANAVFGLVLTLTYGWPVSALIPGHNLSHHKYTNGPKDAMRPSKMRYKHNFWNYLMFPVESTKAIAKFDMEYMEDQKKKNRPIYKQYLLEASVFYPLNILLCLLNWKKYLVVWFVPQMLAKYQLIGMNTLQHDGCPTPEEDKYNHSRNFVGTFLNFMTFNNGYHAIHHMYPGYHWSVIATEHNKQVKPHCHPNLNIPNIISYFYTTHISPAERLWYDGTPYILPPDVPNEPWYTGQMETYSIEDIEPEWKKDKKKE